MVNEASAMGVLDTDDADVYTPQNGKVSAAVRVRTARCPHCHQDTEQSVHEIFLRIDTRYTLSWQCMTCDTVINVDAAWKELNDEGFLDGVS